MMILLYMYHAYLYYLATCTHLSFQQPSQTCRQALEDDLQHIQRLHHHKHLHTEGSGAHPKLLLTPTAANFRSKNIRIQKNTRTTKILSNCHFLLELPIYMTKGH